LNGLMNSRWCKERIKTQIKFVPFTLLGLPPVILV
jgi:hypothetical protein